MYDDAGQPPYIMVSCGEKEHLVNVIHIQKYFKKHSSTFHFDLGNPEDIKKQHLVNRLKSTTV